MGGALAVVAPPLGSFGRVIGPLARASRVGGVVVRAGPLVHAGQSHVTHQRRFCEIIQTNQQTLIKYMNLSTGSCGIDLLFVFLYSVICSSTAYQSQSQ